RAAVQGVRLDSPSRTPCVGRPLNSSTAHAATPDDACAVLEWEDALEPQAEVGEVENAVGLATITAWIDSTARGSPASLSGPARRGVAVGARQGGDQDTEVPPHDRAAAPGRDDPDGRARRRRDCR